MLPLFLAPCQGTYTDSGKYSSIMKQINKNSWYISIYIRLWCQSSVSLAIIICIQPMDIVAAIFTYTYISTIPDLRVLLFPPCFWLMLFHPHRLSILSSVVVSSSLTFFLGSTLTTLTCFYIHHGDQRVFSIWNHHKCLIHLFSLHLNTYGMGLRPLEIF